MIQATRCLLYGVRVIHRSSFLSRINLLNSFRVFNRWFGFFDCTMYQILKFANFDNKLLVPKVNLLWYILCVNRLGCDSILLANNMAFLWTSSEFQGSIQLRLQKVLSILAPFIIIQGV